MQVLEKTDVPAARERPGPTTRLPWPAAIITTLIVFVPFLALLIAVQRFWGHGISGTDVVIAVSLYAVTGHGVTIGFHRLFAHRAFRANRRLKIALAIAGSMAFEGGVISWVANHRRHHVYSDRQGDPHSPYEADANGPLTARGLAHAHVGWLFRTSSTARERYAADLVRDRDLVMVDRLFPLWATLTLALPFAIGWVLGGPGGAGTALLWGGAVRICLLHHATWSINSLCHAYGKRPYRTEDHSTNLAALSVLSMGESWHNFHHAFPDSARHGGDRYQVDSSARLISVFERLGWADHVRTVSDGQRAARRHSAPRC